jgi:hypothetical protein
MAIPVDLEVKPEAGGSVVVIPVSATGSDGKAQIWAVRDEKGASLIRADSQTGVTTVGSKALSIPVYANSSARDAAITVATNGMMIINAQVGTIEVYVGDVWVALATA